MTYGLKIYESVLPFSIYISRYVSPTLAIIRFQIDFFIQGNICPNNDQYAFLNNKTQSYNAMIYEIIRVQAG